MNLTPEQLEKTGRWIRVWIWLCAVITMAASLVNGTSVFDALTVGTLPVVVGFLTALAVDLALVAVLTADSRMQDLGLPTGRVMRWALLAMSLGLNCGASLHAGHWGLAALHALPPLVLAGLTERAQAVGLAFTGEIRRQRDAVRDAGLAEQHQRQTKLNAEADRLQRIADEEDTRRRLENHQRTLTAEAERTATANQEAAEQAERLAAAKKALAEPVEQPALASVRNISTARKPRKQQQGDPVEVDALGRRARSSPKKKAALLYLMQVADTDGLDDVSVTAVARAAGVDPSYVRRNLASWTQEVLAMSGKGETG